MTAIEDYSSQGYEIFIMKILIFVAQEHFRFLYDILVISIFAHITIYSSTFFGINLKTGDPPISNTVLL